MDKILKEALGTSVLKRTGIAGGGCINEGEAFLTDKGTIFVKFNSKNKARLMFDGEYAGLEAMRQTNTIRVPKPIMVLDNPSGGAALVMEYIDLKSVNRFSRKLGEDMARLHMANMALKDKSTSRVGETADYVDKFGFHTTTCCGYIPLDNTWDGDWVNFFAQKRLEAQINLVMEKHGDRSALELWSKLQLIVPSFFKGFEIRPALIHGDLWGGNVAETADGPVVFDPATFYGHHEFEMGIATMFGGFDKNFFEGYHSIIPKDNDEKAKKRLKLYQLFNYLNHWNHFGGSYKGSSISLMKALTS